MTTTRTPRSSGRRATSTRSAAAEGTDRARASGLSSRAFNERFQAVVDNVGRVIRGKDDVIRLALVALFSEGHVLFEDVPGVGKSMMARAIGKSIKASVGRIQCTADMLPTDITGTSVLDQGGSFTFRPGPVFANILLADEINRATPKTQSALLEAMAERTVTVDGETHLLPRPFLVLATQNPVELAGTFPLPEAQLDRFLFRLAMGYPNKEAEKEVLRAAARIGPIDTLGPVMDSEEVLRMIDWAAGVSVAEAVLDYIVELCTATRDEPSFVLGAGPRASISLLWATRALAASEGREDVYPDDVRSLLSAVMSHRLLLAPDASLRGDTVTAVLERVVGRVKPPSLSSARRG